MCDIEAGRSSGSIDKSAKKFTIMAVPTGIGASIGGYAGDANQAARKISEVIPVIVNPNVVNAAVFSGINENMLYVEGKALTDFVAGKIGLIPSKNNKIGIIFDKAIPQNVLNIHINTVNAVKTVYGIDVVGYEITKENAGIEFFITETGISTGSLNNPETLLEAGKKLVEQGAEVLAVVCFFETPPEDNYESGEGVDIVGGIEAVVSHYLYENLGCPCVHAPAFLDVTISDKIVDPKVAAEYITPTFLPCLLLGLRNAPLITNIINGNCITYKDLHSIVMPYNSLGSSIVFDAIKHKIPVYAIKENSTVLNINKYAIGKQNDIIELDSYEEYTSLIKMEIS